MRERIDRILRDSFSDLSAQELKDLMDDLDKGGDSVKETIARVIDEKEDDGSSVCAVCGEKVTLNDYVLFFGPEGLKKQANFCAIDCLEYFLTKLKSLHNKNEFVAGRKRQEDFLE